MNLYENKNNDFILATGTNVNKSCVKTKACSHTLKI